MRGFIPNTVKYLNELNGNNYKKPQKLIKRACGRKKTLFLRGNGEKTHRIGKFNLIRQDTIAFKAYFPAILVLL